MASRQGPAPIPTALKLLRGNPGKKAVNRDEPKPPPIAAEASSSFSSNPPSILNADGKKMWKRLVPILVKVKIMTEVERDALSNLCFAQQTMVKAQRELSKQSLIIKTKAGQWVNPLVAVATQQMKVVNDLLREFGLTPASRSRIRMVGAGDDKKSGGWEDRDNRMKKTGTDGERSGSGFGKGSGLQPPPRTHPGAGARLPRVKGELKAAAGTAKEPFDPYKNRIPVDMDE